ncbi:SCP2 sterol-binding domain-containing protein [Ktedonospora formicarum]|uniref:SCP2 domain-containing protein n=1 Tax=Ktedonospora formicarum TaxID=2778364 RepID=A0A8J3MVL5_9CHLR|nr:SCP2 sterol-binding domain-containing protein [Ktedonospora formicarum]GHO48056.1 hypothetical protein KSX_62190 [Ktedonospora formicarum]
MTISELFTMMPSRMNAEAAAGMTKTIQWNITGDETGTWAFKIENGVGEMIPGGTEDPDIIFTVSAKNWLAIAEGRLDSMKAFMTGKLKVKGDMTIAIKLPQLFPEAIA